ncbi:zinc finger protein 814-like [Cloeon dipterum]|uniref:zinc finger protein 814-like n=1 Tax=Cloeon dipterum TaxID=197152 RepID=UPI00321FDD48
MPRKKSSKVKIDALRQNEDQPQELAGAEVDPSGANKDRNLKRKNDHRGKEEENQEVKLPKKSTSSNEIKKRDKRGECCECERIYASIIDHSKKKHNGELEKCTASDRVCKKYFDSAHNRIEHEQWQHPERKEFCCEFCHHSTDQKGNLKKHVRRMHSEKKIKCGELKCGNMFGSQADLRKHVKMCHTMGRCVKCGKEMNLNALDAHNRYVNCAQ